MPERLLARRERVLVARDEADALVPELDEMLGGDASCGALVHADRGHVELLGSPVHEHEPRAALEQLRVVRVLAAHVGDLGRDEDHPLDAALEEHPHVVALALGRAVRVAEDRREPAPRRVHLHRLGESGEDRIRELGDEEPDRVRRLDAPRRDVEEVAHRALDALLRLGSHRGRAARDPRGGRQANSGAVGDVSKTGHRLRPRVGRGGQHLVSEERNAHHVHPGDLSQVCAMSCQLDRLA